MNLFLPIPVSADGMIADPNAATYLEDAHGLRFTDVVIHVHGWCNNATSAARMSNPFSVGLALADPSPNPSLVLAIHWPSTVTEDDGSPLALLDGLTFYTMEHRADVVGSNAVYAIIRKLVETSDRPLRFILIGHSFGCKVVCSALQTLFDGWNTELPHRFGAVLLQAAFPHNDLEPDEDYGALLHLPLKILATHSTLDTALKNCFPAAQSFNLFRKNRDVQALGAVGPTDAVTTAYGSRFESEDLFPDHDVHRGFDGPAGHHSDILIPRLYQRVAQFKATV